MRTITAILFSLIFVLAAGCTGELTPIEPDPGGGTTTPPPGGDGDGDGPPPSANEQLFNQTVSPLMSECSSCHSVGGPFAPFFLSAEPAGWYDTLIQSEVIGGTPEESTLVTTGVHTGPAFSNEAPVRAWIVDLNTPGQ